MLTTPIVLLLVMTSSSPQDPAARAPVSQASQSTNALGLALYQELGRAKPGQNLFLSPFSLGAALAMAAEGARDETAAQMAQALQLRGIGGIDDLHSGFAELTRRFQAGGGDGNPELAARIPILREQLAAANRQVQAVGRDDGWPALRAAAQRANSLADELNAALVQVGRYELRVANALWTAQQLQLVPAFVAKLTRHYDTGGAIPIDFTADPEAARARINAWVASKTNERIRDLIPSGCIDKRTALVITNAVWFRGEWAEPFEVARTRDEDFRLAAGGTTRARLMHDQRHAGYAAFHGDGSSFTTPHEVPEDPAQQPPTYPDDTGFTMLELPYKGGELAMVVLAPRAPNGLPRLERLLTPSALTAWLGRLQSRSVDLGLLRFVQRSAFDASSALQAVGMRRAFTDPTIPGGAQFAGICADPDPLRQLYITAVQHEACIEVTEKGTEAAAATAVMMAPTMAMPRPVRNVPFVPVFRADRPFVYLIRDVRSGAILFVGRVLDPRA